VSRIVTISAAYGAGGSVVAPAVADALGVTFFDRATAAGEVAVDEERTGGLWSRVLAALAQMPTEGGPSGPLAPASDDQVLRREAEDRLRRHVAGSDGVVLGWAGVLVIEGAFHVRLDGPADARARQGARIEGTLSEADARKRLEETDRIRTLYWKRLYKRDFWDLRPYHLVVDSTALDLDTVRDLVVTGARAFWSR
jgi:cytidylate kinase